MRRWAPTPLVFGSGVFSSGRARLVSESLAQDNGPLADSAPQAPFTDRLRPS